MNLQQLPKLTSRSAKRVGRGVGSGKGSHTTGRGQKGQKSREKVRIFFEGTKMKKSLVKRVPFQRGKNRFKTLFIDPVPLPLSALVDFKGTEVTVAALVKQGFVDEVAAQAGVKLLGSAKLTSPLTVKIPASKSAQTAITKSGGKMEI